ncbi:MAG TPA: hypothetical protein VG795_07800 [Acidimicrobiia bacterium]|nr:hypothetical protein [Acidimicrobiia bacterium]
MIGAAFWAGTSVVDSPKQPTTTTSTATTSTELIEFRDEKAGWAISYPKSWNRLNPDPNDRDVVLVVSENNQRGSIKARVIDLGTSIEEGKLAELTDELVMTEGVRMITQPATIRQGGLPGRFYFYTFNDPASGQEGVHSHYFLFKGSTMISFVFQALPKDDFQRLANLFDEVTASFRVF